MMQHECVLRSYGRREGDVFRLLCAVLTNQGVGCLDQEGLRNPAAMAALIKLAQDERVGPALHEVVAAHPDWEIAASARAMLAQRWQQNVQRNVLMRGMLLELAEAGAAAGLEFLALKGAAWFTEDAIGAAGWRSILDIDVLVDQRHFEAVPALLQRLGYQRASESRRFHVNFHHAPYGRPGTDVTIEVHRHLGWRHHLLSPEIVFASAKYAAPGLLLPAPWCRALHAIIHWQIQDCGLSRCTTPVKEILEVARFLARPDVDWTSVLAHAGVAGASKACTAAIVLASELLAAPLPQRFALGSDASKHIRRSLARRSSPISTWLATEMWRAGTLWRCEKIAYRRFLCGAKPPTIAAAVWLGRAARLPYLTARGLTIAARYVDLRIRQRRLDNLPAERDLVSDDACLTRLPAQEPIAWAALPSLKTTNSTEAEGRYHYEVYGLLISSEIMLPELQLRAANSRLAADVHICVGRIQLALPGDTKDPAVHMQNGQAMLTIPQVARYCVRRGRDVIVEPGPAADPSLVRLFILGSVMGLICHQRGMLALHASAIARGDEAVAFVGEQGQGKSTLAAHCLAHPAVRLVADDILVISFDADGQPFAHPGMPAVKLWRDTLQVLGRSADGLTADWLRAEKFLLPVAQHLAAAPMRLSRVYVLADDTDAGDGSIHSLPGAAAAATIVANTYRIEYIDGPEQRLAHFAASSRLAERVAVHRLARRRSLPRVGSTAGLVMAHFGAASEAA
jgi:hypothetical protein